MDVGHLVRDGLGSATPERTSRVGVAIVGAGPSGLSAAWRLERLGETDYRVFDLEPFAGGTSAFGEDGVVPFPWGAHYVPVPRSDNHALVQLLREMGSIESFDEQGEPVCAEEQLVRAPEERVFYKGRWYEGLYLRAGASHDDLRQLAAFHAEIDRWIAFRDGAGRRAFTLPVARGSADAEVTALDKLSMQTWLDQHGFTSPRLRWLVDYACRDDYGVLARDTSAWAGIFYFASRVHSPGADPAPLFAWPEGNGHIVKHLANAAGERLTTRAIVTDVIPVENGVELRLLDLATRTWEMVRADRAIVAAPRFVARRIVRPLRDRPRNEAASFEYGAWMVANLHLRGRPESRGFPLSWDNVLYESPSLGYVSATHQALVDHGPTVLTYYYPMTDSEARAGRNRLSQLDHAACSDVVLADLRRAHAGIDSLVERIDVYRWGHAMVRPAPGTVWSTARKQAAEPIDRIHFAHTDLSGVALFEEAQYHGVRAAEAVARDRGRTFESLLG